jgi:hypothetical protein
MWRAKKPLRSCIGLCAAAALSALALSNGSAFAVSDQVRDACKDDYFLHCSAYEVGSDALRQCMRNVGEGLSTPCLVALVHDGEITKADVDRYNARHADNAASSGTERKIAAESSTGPDRSTVVHAAGMGPASKAQDGRAAKKTLSATSRNVKVANASEAQNGGKGAQAETAGKPALGGKSAKAAAIADKSTKSGRDREDAGPVEKTTKSGNTNKAIKVASLEGTKSGKAGRDGKAGKSIAKSSAGKVASLGTSANGRKAAQEVKVSKDDATATTAKAATLKKKSNASKAAHDGSSAKASKSSLKTKAAEVKNAGKATQGAGVTSKKSKLAKAVPVDKAAGKPRQIDQSGKARDSSAAE